VALRWRWLHPLPNDSVRGGDPSPESEDDAEQRAGDVVATFRIRADLDPQLVARIAHQLNLSNLAPMAFSMVSAPDGTASVEATLEGLPYRKAELIHRKIQQLTCVIEADADIRPFVPVTGSREVDTATPPSA
jgi:hypothetical protein